MQNLSTRAAKPLAARNEGVSPRRKNKRPSFLVSSISQHRGLQSLWMRSRTKRILREKADCKQSTLCEQSM